MKKKEKLFLDSNIILHYNQFSIFLLLSVYIIFVEITKNIIRLQNCVIIEKKIIKESPLLGNLKK